MEEIMNATNFRGSARVSRAGDGVLATANFRFAMQPAPRDSFTIKDFFGATPKVRAGLGYARETRVRKL